MDDLISRNSLYEKMVEAEDLARQRVIGTPPSFPGGALNPEYIRCLTQVSERTRFKELIYDEPAVKPTLNGYPLEHLAFIARVMEREGKTPAHVARMLDDTGAVLRLILDEIQRQAENGFEDVSHPFADDVMMGD